MLLVLHPTASVSLSDIVVQAAIASTTASSTASATIGASATTTSEALLTAALTAATCIATATMSCGADAVRLVLPAGVSASLGTASLLA